MNPGRYCVTNMAMNNVMLRNGYRMAGSNGFLSKMFAGIKSFNWGKLLNGTSKTLNVVNQAIPIVKQVKPVVGNVRSMVRLAHAFGSETTRKQTENITNIAHMTQKAEKKEVSNNNYPNFFI